MRRPRILIADDEPLLRAELIDSLKLLWPDAEVVGEAGDGFEALRLARELEPDLAFLDIRMPGLTGLQVAATFGLRIHVVFVTAHQEHALEAFEEGALDYVLKPTDPARLARTVNRLRERLELPPPDLAPVMRRIAQGPKTDVPQWLQTTVGSAIHFIDLTDVMYFCAETKYTKVVTPALESHIRTPLKDLADALEEVGFWQIHRSYVVSVKRIAKVTRDEDGALWVSLRDHIQKLPVSQRFQHRFKGM